MGAECETVKRQKLNCEVGDVRPKYCCMVAVGLTALEKKFESRVSAWYVEMVLTSLL
jgi:hypothetical protein